MIQSFVLNLYDLHLLKEISKKSYGGLKLFIEVSYFFVIEKSHVLFKLHDFGTGMILRA